MCINEYFLNQKVIIQSILCIVQYKLLPGNEVAYWGEVPYHSGVCSVGQFHNLSQASAAAAVNGDNNGTTSRGCL